MCKCLCVRVAHGAPDDAANMKKEAEAYLETAVNEDADCFSVFLVVQVQMRQPLKRVQIVLLGNTVKTTQS